MNEHALKNVEFSAGDVVCHETAIAVVNDSRINPGACSSGGIETQDTDRVRVIDCTPAADVHRSVPVRMGSESTGLAFESGLIGPVGA